MHRETYYIIQIYVDYASEWMNTYHIFDDEKTANDFLMQLDKKGCYRAVKVIKTYDEEVINERNILE